MKHFNSMSDQEKYECDCLVDQVKVPYYVFSIKMLEHFKTKSKTFKCSKNASFKMK